MSLNGSPSLPTLHPVRMESSALAEVVYDGHRQVLQAEFRDGSIYQYSAVPARVYEELLLANSKGGFFNRSIRGHFPERRLRKSCKLG
jgi:KTSC domain